jgi:hypothetical protein
MGVVRLFHEDGVAFRFVATFWADKGLLGVHG